MAKKWMQGIKKWMTKQMDLPEDVLMDFPRITMIGQIHLYIENHKGLLTFTDEEFRVLFRQGQLLVKGKGFVIKTILPEELLLEGRIEQIFYIHE
ncbi:sporulation protein YqfC [Fervidibacillus albus]|uniref:Sporulation protein YqfC n=1 Tax=Fervidibacillus albus TaxID=2980026 RepID=A0A9E8LVC7_9BACI|nr:sporulation protein YqfC [Fervidibacillus albus]WAA10377.1 sporulation protein YqfC [Fervidibacillus albus]